MQKAETNAVNISEEDLSSFQAAHFTGTSIDHFTEHFLGPVEDSHHETVDEDDGLGYYSDGIKRTLTDEQIAIFRHSEIEALLRDRRHAEEAREDSCAPTPTKAVSEADDIEDGELEEGAVEAEIVAAEILPSSKMQLRQLKKQHKGQRTHRKGFFKQNVKPDLRKRTWDKVDAGMDSLAYDEEPARGATPTKSAQRRRISYDD